MDITNGKLIYSQNKLVKMNHITLVTKHQKAKLIAPALAALNIDVVECSAFDTDTLGTFSGEITRTLSPKQAALTKAKKACELTGAEWGLGSEGSFGGGPYPGLMNWNEEILCLYHRDTQNVIYAYASGPTLVNAINASTLSDLENALEKYPNQHWMLTFEDQLYKGLSAQHVLDVVSQKKRVAPYHVKPDLRAMYCPERQKMIRQAASNLAVRLQSPCPACDAPDFVIKSLETGLSCRACSLPTERIKSRIKRCDSCHHQEVIAATEKQADPMYCPLCNP